MLMVGFFFFQSVYDLASKPAKHFEWVKVVLVNGVGRKMSAVTFK